MPAQSTTLSQRLEAAVTASKRTKKEIEEAAEMPKGYLSTLVAGRRGARSGVGSVMLRRIAEALGVSFEWLATGEGHMFRDPNDGRGPEPPAPRPVPSDVLPSAKDFPNCEHTIAYLKQCGLMSAELATFARRMAPSLPSDLPGPVWYALLSHLHESGLFDRKSGIRPAQRPPAAAADDEVVEHTLASEPPPVSQEPAAQRHPTPFETQELPHYRPKQ